MIIVNGERIKGSIYFDRTVKKRLKNGTKVRQNSYRANVIYCGIRYEKRSKNEDVLKKWLSELANKFQYRHATVNKQKPTSSHTAERPN